MQCVKYIIGSLPIQKDATAALDFCVWNNGGELFGDVSILDEIFACKGELLNRIHGGSFDENQVWFDGSGKVYCIFPVLNDVAAALQDLLLGKFTTLSVGALKRVVMKDYLPFECGVSFNRRISEENVTIAIKVQIYIIDSNIQEKGFKGDRKSSS